MQIGARSHKALTTQSTEVMQFQPLTRIYCSGLMIQTCRKDAFLYAVAVTLRKSEIDAVV
jgi:hypothetical protein